MFTSLSPAHLGQLRGGASRAAWGRTADLSMTDTDENTPDPSTDSREHVLTAPNSQGLN